jgi:hypothetical protein
MVGSLWLFYRRRIWFGDFLVAFWDFFSEGARWIFCVFRGFLSGVGEKVMVFLMVKSWFFVVIG